jgi:predicted NAD/FAD-dependent oxidoreductase
MAYQQPVRLEIIIVGAGIIGFAASAALRRVRHRITVSKSCRSQEQGLNETQSLEKNRYSVEKQDSQLRWNKWVQSSGFIRLRFC